MFESLSDRLGGVFDRLTKAGALSEADVDAALREVRTALLEADVSLAVARDFIKAVKTRATGQAVTKSVTPGQQVVKIVHDELIAVLGGDGPADALKIDNPPSAILMVGLQGSGKTTTTAKLAKRLKERNGKKVLLASLDTNRPAAMEQLAILAGQIGVDSLPISTAAVITWRTAQRTKSGHGRSFLPASAINSVATAADTGKLLPAFQTAASTGAADFLSALTGAALAPVLLKRSGLTTTPITGANVGSLFRQQRRRQSKVSPTYV